MFSDDKFVEVLDDCGVSIDSGIPLNSFDFSRFHFLSLLHSRELAQAALVEADARTPATSVQWLWPLTSTLCSPPGMAVWLGRTLILSWSYGTLEIEYYYVVHVFEHLCLRSCGQKNTT